MKRSGTTQKYKQRQRRREKKEMLRRRGARSRRTVRKRYKPQRVTIPAPERLGVFDYAEETLAFCNGLRKALRRPRTHVSLDLAGLKEVRSDALILIRAIMRDHARGSGTGGNLPESADVAAKMKLSGFFHGFLRPPVDLPEPKGMMRSASHRRVYSRVAADLVGFASKHAAMTRPVENASSQTLVEAMTNTHAHAGGGERTKSGRHRRKGKRWFAGVYCEGDEAYFTFVDLGVGMLKSAHARQYLRAIGLAPDAVLAKRLMGEMFDGVVGSSTGDPGRGHGLPEMKYSAQQGHLPDLRVLSSSVLGRVADSNYQEIASNMQGTVLRWKSSN